MKRLLTVIFIASFLLSGYGAYAQDVSFHASGPSTVAVAEMFQVSFSLDAKPDSFAGPDLGSFNVIAGPTVSEGHRVEFVNGKLSKSEEYTYTYVLQLAQDGNYTIPAATAVVKGREYKTQPMPVEAVTVQGSSQQPASQGQEAAAATGTIADDDIFLRLVVDKTEVYKNEPVRIFLKLYSRVNIGGYTDAKIPTFNGFWIQDLDTRQYQWQRENYNSKVYDTNIISEYLLYPQQSGTLTIDPFEMTFLVQIVTRSRRQSLMDDFFGGGPEIQEVRKEAASEPVKITVKDWPAGAPAGFSGAVGNFTMTTDMPSETITANSSATLTVRISGNGNLPLIQAPKISIPTSFEQFNIKTTESLNRSAEGISGYRQFEYPIIARAEGDYVIEPVQFAYFNPANGRYVNLRSEDIRIKVLPDSTGRSGVMGNGLVSGLSKEDVRILGEDIRFIETENPSLVRKDSFFVGSLAYFIIMVAALGLFVFLLIFMQKRIREMQNAEAVRGKRANKVALQRLQRAKVYMEQDNQRKFYEEMLQTLWGYMSDKLNMPVAIMTKDNVREMLQRKGVNEDYINRYVDLISECEYAQYSPAEAGQMYDIYRGAVDTVSKLESVIKKRR